MKGRQVQICRASFGTKFQNPYHDELVATAKYISQRGKGILGACIVFPA